MLRLAFALPHEGSEAATTTGRLLSTTDDGWEGECAATMRTLVRPPVPEFAIGRLICAVSQLSRNASLSPPETPTVASAGLGTMTAPPPAVLGVALEQELAAPRHSSTEPTGSTT